MPFITINLLKGRTAEEKRQIGDAIHAALVASGVPAADRFQKFVELEPENFIYDKHYPDLVEGRSDKFMIIEILLSVGRSVKVKRGILETLIKEMEKIGMRSEDVFVSFQETQWENWAFGNGKILHA